MSDWVTDPSISNRMSAQRRRDTAAELLLRRELRSLEIRYRLCHPVPGMPRRSIDIALVGKRIAVFVDGCFWHGCPEHGVSPRRNAQRWLEKITRNKARDAETTEHLLQQGWIVIRVWEHEDAAEVAERVRQEVKSRDDRKGR